MNGITSRKAKAINYVLFFALIAFVFFFPTSEGGIILEGNNVGYTYSYYGIALLLSVLYLMTNEINRKRFAFALVLFTYMSFATFISVLNVGGVFSFARLIYIVVPMLILSTDDIPRFKKKFILNAIEILTLIIIVWNFLLIARNATVMAFTKDTYSQFVSYTTSVFVDNGRPVFTFGIYSYGAFFYAGLFMFWYIASNEVKGYARTRYNAYMIILIIFQLLLRGSTALFLGAYMLFMFLKTFGRHKYRFLLLPVFLIGGTYFIYIQNFDWTRLLIGNENNGFLSRYGFKLFEENYRALKDTVFGIGYSVIRQYRIDYTDSGYVVLFTMGNVFLPIIMYYCLFKKIKHNTPQKVYIFIFILYMLFEFSLPGILYTKLALFMAFIIMAIRNITDDDSIANSNETRVRFALGKMIL